MLRTVTGAVTGTDFATADAALLDSPAALRVLRYALIDFGEATNFLATQEEIRRVAEVDHRIAELVPHLCLAIVAPRDLQFGISRMWQVFVEGTGWETAVFRDRREAEAWLFRKP